MLFRSQRAPLYIDDASDLSVSQLRAKARRMVQRHGVKLVVVDYLQLLKSTNARAKSREQEVSDISAGLKACGKELGVTMLVLSQLNRELERDKDRKPKLSDLRESGSIEQDADVIGMLYKPRQDGDEDEDSGTVATNLLIAKQRNGPVGDVHLVFMKRFTRFEQAARDGGQENG